MKKERTIHIIDQIEMEAYDVPVSEVKDLYFMDKNVNLRGAYEIIFTSEWGKLQLLVSKKSCRYLYKLTGSGTWYASTRIV